MQSYQGEALSMYRRAVFCLLLAAGWLVFENAIIPRAEVNSSLTPAQGQTFSIGGRVTEPPSEFGPAISGVTMTLIINSTTQSVTQTDSNGNFSFANIAAGSDYDVTPSKTGWVFHPVSQGGTNVGSDITVFFTGATSSPTPTPTPTPTATPTPTPTATPTPTPTATPTPTPTATPTPTPTPNSLQFAASTVTVAEAPNVTTHVELAVTRVGDVSGPASVHYATTDGTANERSDYLTAIGRLRFAAGETSKTIKILIINDSYGEGPETFTLSLSVPIGGTLGAPSVATVTINSDESVSGPNPVKAQSFDTDFFVRQHYVDFFNREADPPGLAFWKNQIDECVTQECRELRKINVSAAFFLSIEFQQTGYLVERLYKTAYGDAIGTSNFGPTHQLPVPVIRFYEFLEDTQEIGRGVVVGAPGADQLLENNKQALISDFVLRSRFVAAYPLSMTPTQFVDTLNTNAGGVLSPSERNQLIIDLTDNVKTRAQVLRAIAEDPELIAAESNRAFVLAQYFGYLRRNPNEIPDGDYSGYDFWLTKLNQFGGNFVNAEMVKAFITSAEYLERFGP
jgi:hypothetical protein